MTHFSFPTMNGALSVVTETKFIELVVLPVPQKTHLPRVNAFSRVWPDSGNKASISSHNVSHLGKRIQTTVQAARFLRGWLI